VKTETLTIAAREVRAGDVTPYGISTTDAVSEFTGTVGFNIGPAILTLSEDHRITISRPVADPCPRGRMVIDSEGDLDLNGWNFLLNMGEGREIHPAKAAAGRRIVALWNEAESAEPYRTTEEIERGRYAY
jgi:hypothetical protein